MKFKKIIFLFLSSILVLSQYGFESQRNKADQPQGQEYNLKAAFLYNFLDYVQWNSKNTETLNIAVLGDSEMYASLAEISKSKKTGSRSIQVRQISSVKEIGTSHVLFVSRNYKFGMEAVQARMVEKPTLIVSEEKGDIEKGSHINFLMAENKLKFEVNLKTASQSGIKIGSQLLQHAALIKK